MCTLKNKSITFTTVRFSELNLAKPIQMIWFGLVEIRTVVGPWLIIVVLLYFETLDLGSVDAKDPLDDVKYRQAGEIEFANKL